MEYRDLPRGEDDGLPIAEVGGWVREKYLRVWMYDQLFATGMKKRWDERVYVDLFSGSGYSRVRGSKEILMGSPLLAVQIPDRFDRYVFCDENPDLLDALRARVERIAPGIRADYVPGDVDRTVGAIKDRVPRGDRSHKVLSFCFADPFSVRLRFQTIRQLSEGRYIDFLILLALGMDANLNLPTYLDQEHRRIEEFLDNPDWRTAWADAEKRGDRFIPFLAKQYSRAMERLRYLTASLSQMYAVRSDQKNLPLYYLAFFSRHEKGYDFWKEVLKYSTPQIDLKFDI
jgi:three-Cys-motif partner protein